MIALVVLDAIACVVSLLGFAGSLIAAGSAMAEDDREKAKDAVWTALACVFMGAMLAWSAVVLWRVTP